MQQNAKQNILNKIKQALQHAVPVPFPQQDATQNVFQPLQQEIEIEFAENFTKLQGRFSFCANHHELSQQLVELFATRNWQKIYCTEDAFTAFYNENLHTKELATCDAAITGCELLVARTGSLMLSSANLSGRTTSVYAPVHICIAYTSQLVYDISDGLKVLSDKYQDNLPSLISLATGPSRTADIEKTLVVGVHGPKEVFCFLVEDK
jgi:L-lactate dehydrogenase complex protein LldG